MRGKVAKALRRNVYRDQSVKDTKYGKRANGQIIALGLRATFKRVKKNYNSLRPFRDELRDPFTGEIYKGKIISVAEQKRVLCQHR